jgi:hypothetical protein
MVMIMKIDTKEFKTKLELYKKQLTYNFLKEDNRLDDAIKENSDIANFNHGIENLQQFITDAFLDVMKPYIGKRVRKLHFLYRNVYCEYHIEKIEDNKLWLKEVEKGRKQRTLYTLPQSSETYSEWLEEIEVM